MKPKFIDIIEGSYCDEKDDISEKIMPAKTLDVKETPEHCAILKTQRAECWELLVVP